MFEKVDTLNYAARTSDMELLKSASFWQLNDRDEDGRTPIHYAAYRGNIDALVLITTRGGKPEKCDFAGYSALHFAAKGGNLDCVRFLTNFNMNLLWILDNNYRTAKDIALIHDQTAVYNYLEKISHEQQSLLASNFDKILKDSIHQATKRKNKYETIEVADIENKIDGKPLWKISFRLIPAIKKVYRLKDNFLNDKH